MVELSGELIEFGEFNELSGVLRGNCLETSGDSGRLLILGAMEEGSNTGVSGECVVVGVLRGEEETSPNFGISLQIEDVECPFTMLVVVNLLSLIESSHVGFLRVFNSAFEGTSTMGLVDLESSVLEVIVDSGAVGRSVEPRVGVDRLEIGKGEVPLMDGIVAEMEW